MDHLRGSLDALRGAIAPSEGRASARGVEVGIGLLIAVLCIAYVLTGLARSEGAPAATPDSLHNAILSRNLARDGSYRVQVVQYHAGRFEVEHVPEMHGVLQPLLLAAAFIGLGPDVALLRVPGILFAAATGGAAYLLARRLFGPLPGLAACALVLLSRQLFEVARSGTDDAGFAFLYFGSIALAVRALDDDDRKGLGVAGLVGGLATLQKPEGILLPVVYCAVALTESGGTPGRIAKRWAVLSGPALAAIAVYLARNFAAHGSLSFRWGAIDWLYKSRGLDAFFRPYDAAPGLLEVAQELGAQEIFRIVGRQLLQLLDSVIPVLPPDRSVAPLVEPWIATPLALVALAVLWRRQRAFVALTAATFVASGALMCLVWHYESRFFLMMLPLLAVAFAGLVERGLAASAPGWKGAAIAGVSLLVVAGLVVAVLRTMSGEPARRGAVHGRCKDAMAWISRSTGERDRILSFKPWHVTWVTGRPSIVVPSGGPTMIEKINEIYEPDWLLAQPSRSRARDVRALESLIVRPTPGFTPRLAYRGRVCRVYALDREPRDPDRRGDSR